MDDPLVGPLGGLVRGEGELCYAKMTARGKLTPVGCQKVSIVYDTGAPKSVLHPRVAPVAQFPRGPAERVRGVGKAAYPTTVAFLRTPGCGQFGVFPWVAAEPTEAFGVDVIIGDDYMEAANVPVTPASRGARCTP